MNLQDHIRVIEQHAGERVIDAVLVNAAPISGAVLERYEADGAIPLCCPSERLLDASVIHRRLLAPGPKLRHDPEATAEGLIAAWQMFNAAARLQAPGG